MPFASLDQIYNNLQSRLNKRTITPTCCLPLLGEEPNLAHSTELTTKLQGEHQEFSVISVKSFSFGPYLVINRILRSSFLQFFFFLTARGTSSSIFSSKRDRGVVSPAQSHMTFPTGLRGGLARTLIVLSNGGGRSTPTCSDTALPPDSQGLFTSGLTGKARAHLSSVTIRQEKWKI